jgi:hypothetical protein
MSTTWEYRVPHPVYGWVLKPGIHYHYRLPKDVVSVAYNSRGFRDTEHAYARPAATQRIVVLGDSFMEAYSVELEEAFHKQLEAALGSRGRSVEVINLGVGGYGTLQEYLMFMHEGRRYEPDYVLLAFYPGNDLRNNSLELESIVNPDHMKVLSRPFLDTQRSDSFAVTRVDYEAAVEHYRRAQAENDTAL